MIVVHHQHWYEQLTQDNKTRQPENKRHSHRRNQSTSGLTATKTPFDKFKGKAATIDARVYKAQTNSSEQQLQVLERQLDTIDHKEKRFKSNRRKQNEFSDTRRTLKCRFTQERTSHVNTRRTEHEDAVQTQLRKKLEQEDYLYRRLKSREKKREEEYKEYKAQASRIKLQVQKASGKLGVQGVLHPDQPVVKRLEKKLTKLEPIAPVRPQRSRRRQPQSIRQHQTNEEDMASKLKSSCHIVMHPTSSLYGNVDQVGFSIK